MKIKRLIDFTEIKHFIVKPRGCTIDSVVFRLHYRATVVILVGFCLMVTAKQFFGHPMECIAPKVGGGDDDGQFGKILNRWCFISTTFSVDSAWKKEVGLEIPYPGIDKRIVVVKPDKNSLENDSKPEVENTKVTFHAYYQWVCFVLLLQAVIFYLPHVFWKLCEGSLTRRLVNGLDHYIMEKDEKKEKVTSVAEYYLKSIGQHDFMILSYTAMEILNLVNIICQLLLVDSFLGGKWANYGMDILAWKDWSDFPLQYDPMMEVFPRMTKCTFHRFGPSGDIQKDDATCVLPINIVNEKGYMILWFWFYALLMITVCSLIYSFLLLLFPFLRVLVLKFSGGKFVAKRDVQKVLKYSGNRAGDYFLLHLLGQNMTSANFGGLMRELALRIADKEKMQ